MTVKRINVKNRTYQFLNGMINIKNFDSKLLKLKQMMIMKKFIM